MSRPAAAEHGLEQRLRRHVLRLAEDIGERNVWHPEALAAAEAYIRNEWEAMGYEVHAQRYRAAGVECANLEVVIDGSSLPAQIVVAGAHYDSVRGSPGADDNASGVAGLIEIGRLLRQSPLARSLRLVAFVNEEMPFFFTRQMGSDVYARAARARGDDIRVMVSLEMLGCYSDANGSQGYPPLLRLFYPDRGNFIAFVANLRSRSQLRAAVAAFKAASDFPCQSLAAPALVPGVAWSDQLAFWRAGYAALMVTDTAFYRYPHYHAATDTPDRIDYRSMARVVAGLACSLAALAAAAAP